MEAPGPEETRKILPPLGMAVVARALQPSGSRGNYLADFVRYYFADLYELVGAGSS